MEKYKIRATERYKNRYSYSYKIAVVEAVDSGQLSQNQAAKSMVYIVRP